MEQLIKYAIGIDMAMDKFDVCLMSVDITLQTKIKATRKFTNTPKGFEDLLAWVTKHRKVEASSEFLMEATGVYHEKLAIWLTEQGEKVFVVLPNKSKKYMQALGLKTKNDGVDAMGLAMMSVGNRFQEWRPIGKYNYELRLLTRHYQSTQEIKTAYGNQIHALEHSGYCSKQIIKQLKKSIELCEKQLKESKINIAKHIAKDEEVKQKVDKICVIKGVDILTVATIIAETNGFELFKNQSQLVSYSGYDIVENQSGKRVGKTKISKKGNSRIRRILHMPAFNVVKYEPSFNRFYKRIFERTNMKMKGYVAVQKKLLLTMYTLWKKNEAFDKNYETGITSGNDEHKLLFPFLPRGQSKKIVPQQSGTTLDKLQYNESHKVLFPL